MDGQVRVWRPDWPCPVAHILGQQRRGPGDPTYRVDGVDHWRAMRTPQGPATVLVRPLPGEVYAEAWGPGAEWALDHVPALLGAEDDPSGFEPRHPLVAEAVKRHPHWRFGRTGLVLESLVPTVIEQKVTGQEAFAGFRQLVRRHGEAAPGPRGDLYLPPDAATLRQIPSWEWLRLHIDPARSATVVRAARIADGLQRLSHLSGEEVDRRLRSIPGVGEWTSAEVRQRALGDPDAVSFGDYHLAANIGWTVTGQPFDDRELAEFLEPWRPQRGRAAAYLGLLGGHRPRRGPRLAPRTHLPAPGRR